MSKLYTLGYTSEVADAWLADLMANPAMMLIDIRKSAFSWSRPTYRGYALARRYGNQYMHVPELGNLNYREQSLPIQLVNPDAGLPKVLYWLECGYSVCLLCTCSQVWTCHRLVVCNLLVQTRPDLYERVIHL